MRRRRDSCRCRGRRPRRPVSVFMTAGQFMRRRRNSCRQTIHDRRSIHAVRQFIHLIRLTAYTLRFASFQRCRRALNRASPSLLLKEKASIKGFPLGGSSSAGGDEGEIRIRRFSARRIHLNIPVGNISRLQGISQATPISLAAGKFHRGACAAQYPLYRLMMLPSIALIDRIGESLPYRKCRSSYVLRVLTFVRVITVVP